MTAKEMYRIIEWFRAMGYGELQACDLLRYAATGTDLPDPEKDTDQDE